jgi:ABC-2 type transport system ATP-binding protein
VNSGSTDAPLVDVRALRKTFPGGTVALRDIDLRIEGPGIFGVAGPDGAGKTTLLRALVGLLDFKAERMRVLGHTLPGEALALKKESGYVPQTWGLYRVMTVAQNLRFFATVRGISEEAFRARKAELLEATDLAPFEDRLAGNLSGGMKQKLSIACGLLHKPRLLVLDEPNNGVDLAARHEIWQILKRDPETLVILSTNYIDEAVRCDELIYLFRGRVIARGRPQEIIARQRDRRSGCRVLGYGLGPLAEALAAEPWVIESRYTGDSIEIETEGLPTEEVGRRVRAHPLGGRRVALVEQHHPDLASAFHALTHEAAAAEARDGR